MKPQQQSDRLLKVREAEELLGISRSKLYELLSAGELPSVTIPGKGERHGRRIRLSAINAFMDRNASA